MGEIIPTKFHKRRKIILSFFGFAYIIYAVVMGIDAETVIQQVYTGIRVLAGWLYLIWIAIIIK